MGTTIRLIAAAVLAGGVGVAADAALAQASGVTRTDLQRHDLSVPGYETVQARIDVAPGAHAPRHTHPGEEIIYVLAGSLQYQVGDAPWRTYNTGDVLFIPAGTIHAARNVGTVLGSELATYVVEKGKALLVPAK